MSDHLERLAAQISGHLKNETKIADRLSYLAGLGKVVSFSTSLSAEDQIITHAIATQNLPIEIFTLDTGRMFEETYKVLSETEEHFGIKIKTMHPDPIDLADYVQKQGINGFYKSVEARKACCFVRKVAPLNKALEGVEIWISGLRHVHSDNRHDLPFAEVDIERGLIKVYPIVDLEDEQMWNFIKAHQIPYNELHDKGFPSIGCAPCTRAVKPGELARAGRWWWEDGSQECGLHMDNNGRLVRKSA